MSELRKKWAHIWMSPEEREEVLEYLRGNPVAVMFPNRPQAAKPTLYYRVSPANGGLVFATPGRAEYVSRIYNALGAKTWGELKDLLPSTEYDYIVSILFDDNGKPRPQSTDPFNSMDVPGYCDGDYPDWLQEEMPGIVPDEILDKYGSYELTGNGAYYHIEVEHEEAICRDLKARGFDVIRRDDLYFC